MMWNDTECQGPCMSSDEVCWDSTKPCSCRDTQPPSVKQSAVVADLTSKARVGQSSKATILILEYAHQHMLWENLARKESERNKEEGPSEISEVAATSAECCEPMPDLEPCPGPWDRLAGSWPGPAKGPTLCIILVGTSWYLHTGEGQEYCFNSSV